MHSFTMYLDIAKARMIYNWEWRELYIGLRYPGQSCSGGHVMPVEIGYKRGTCTIVTCVTVRCTFVYVFNENMIYTWMCFNVASHDRSLLIT